MQADGRGSAEAFSRSTRRIRIQFRMQTTARTETSSGAEPFLNRFSVDWPLGCYVRKLTGTSFLIDFLRAEVSQSERRFLGPNSDADLQPRCDCHGSIFSRRSITSLFVAGFSSTFLTAATREGR